MKAFGKTCLLSILLLAAGLFSAAALEVESGRLRLVLHEGIGRFSLYTRSTSASTEYIPLFVDQDPRTSGISLVVNNKIYKLGEAAEFSEKAVKTEDPVTARFQWESRSLEIVQEFTPVSSSGQSSAEGVRISIRIRNRSRSRLSVGLRLCLDTYLGEANLSHFTSDHSQEIRSELTITGSNMIRYWLSPSAGSPQSIGLLCMTSGSDITSPDKIVFANWKRLSEASWDYKTSSRRNFNLMPYSINDSAVCMYYDPVDLPVQESREIVIVLANVTMSDYAGGGQIIDTGISTAQSSGEPTVGYLQTLRDSLSTKGGSAEQSLDVLNKLIGKIDELLASEDPISDEELRLMEEILSDIKDKSERYSSDR